ncbi:restriction endonuclease subunit S [Enterococcus faecalis]|uniref:restriction endonuclease subunit S n=1 Tax=Enterococcus faecalis TaxID=1351 RepID=UPI0001E96833|nr:restriction endonuclease subunit S [Enterococcus faecalis]EFQ69399.1 type I restriction modification DNA specificity domain protein [Enterococcus faecalis TX0470]KAJ84419.1 Type I restriction-modification system, specificity subunit S [Enterococcus faecalis NY9]
MKKEQKNSPNLRFKGFTEDWELCKLKEITERVKGNDGRMDLPTLTISAGQGWLNQKDRFSGNIAGKEQKNYTLLLKNELSYNHGNSKLAKYGAVFLLKTYEEALVPRVYHSFKSTKNSDPDFLEYIFATKKPDKELGKLVSSGARMDGLLNINYDDFSNIKINIPHVHEQKKISNLLRKIDNTITLHQRKLEQLKELKKAYLQVMFPAKDERVPKVRFAAFEGEWAHRKLGEITESFSGGTPTAGKSEYYGGDIPFIRSGEISSDSTELFITENGLNSSSAKMVKVGDILYALYGATSGEVGISKITGAINQAILAIRPSKNDNSYLIIQWLRKQKNTIISTYLQGGQGNLSSSIVKNLIIMLPQNKEEQEKVGIFFKRLDDIITLHQNKLEQLKDLKTSYLQNMFI